MRRREWERDVPKLVKEGRDKGEGSVECGVGDGKRKRREDERSRGNGDGGKRGA